MKKWPSGRPLGWTETPAYQLNMNHGVFVQRPEPELKISTPKMPELLNRGERGAIILPDFSMKRKGRIGIEISDGPFDPTVLRTSLLLFDRLDYPSNTMLELGPSFPPGLEESPIFQRTHVPVQGDLTPDLYSRVVQSAFQALNKREPGLWLIARGSDGTVVPPQVLDQQAGLLMKLVDALPVPDLSVPLDDVMLFKERRRDELLAMRHYMEELVLEVGRSGFGGLAETVAFEKFDKALADHATVLRQTNFAKCLASLEIKFHWSDLPKNLLPAAVAVKAGLPLLDAGLVGIAGVLTSFSIESGVGLRRGGKDGAPFEYLIRAGKEL